MNKKLKLIFLRGNTLWAIILCAFFILCYEFVKANQQETWVKIINKRFNKIQSEILKLSNPVLDPQGNTIMLAQIKTSATSKKISLCKIDKDGNDTWNDAVLSSSVDDFGYIALDKIGNIVSIKSSSGGSVIPFEILKLDSSGKEILFSKTYISSRDIGVGGIIYWGMSKFVIDSAGNMIIGGIFQSGLLSDFLVIKLTPAGIFSWARIYDGGNDDSLISLAVDSSDNIIVAGNSYSLSGTRYDYCVVKYNPSGYRQWVSLYDGSGQGGDGFDYVTDIQVDHDNKIIVLGSFSSRYHGVVKYGSDGGLIWVKSYLRQAGDQLSCLAVDLSNNIIMAGRLFRAKDAKDLWINNDYLVTKCDSLGNKIWERTYDAGENDTAGSLLVDGQNNIIVSGEISYPCLPPAATVGREVLAERSRCLIKYDPNGNNYNNLLDQDLDGVFDYLEAIIGTNIFMYDTDKDGWWDGIEIFCLHTDPLSPSSPPPATKPCIDQDKDGLPQKFYDTYGSYNVDPNDTNPDIDGDGVKDGFEFTRVGQYSVNNVQLRPPVEGLSIKPLPPLVSLAAWLIKDLNTYYNRSTTTLEAAWSLPEGMPDQYIKEYSYSIGNSIGGNELIDWTSCGEIKRMRREDLSLIVGKTYYINVKDKNIAGLWSDPVSSPGIIIDNNPPQVTDLSVKNQQAIRDISINFSVQDDISKIYLVEFETIGPDGKYISKIVYDGYGKTERPPFLGIKEAIPLGVQQSPLSFYVRTMDTAGNQTIKNFSLDFTRVLGSIKINNDAVYTTSSQVVLNLVAAANIVQMRFSNDGVNYSAPETYNTTKNWALSAGYGVKTVYVQFKAETGDWSGVFNDSIIMNAPPRIEKLYPSSGIFYTDYNFYIITSYSDLNSFSDLRDCMLFISSVSDNSGYFYAFYNPNSNKLYLVDDVKWVWKGGFSPGSANIIENSFVKLDCSKTSVSKFDNTITVNWNITFKANSASSYSRGIYLLATDKVSCSTGWVYKGSCIVRKLSYIPKPPVPKPYQ